MTAIRFTPASVPPSGGTFTGDIVVPAETYGSGWDGSNEAPTKNDVYDKVESVIGSVPLLRGAVNDYVGTPHVSRSAGVLTADRLHATPFWVRHTTTFDRIAAELTTGAANATLRLGVAAHNTSTQRPGALLLDAGTVDGSGVAAVLTLTISLELTPGLYWLLGAAQGAGGATAQWRRLATIAYSLPSTTAGGSAPGLAWNQDSVSAGFPDPIATPGQTSLAPQVQLRRSV